VSIFFTSRAACRNHRAPGDEFIAGAEYFDERRVLGGVAGNRTLRRALASISGIEAIHARIEITILPMPDAGLMLGPRGGIMQNGLPFEEIVRGIGDAAVYSDRDGIIRWWNAGAAALFGFTADEALGASLDLIVPEKLRDAHWRGFHAAVASGESRYAGRVMRTRGVHKTDGKVYIELSLNLVKDNDGAVIGSVAIARPAPPDAR
jgi:PAS domain S-box-containing protein